VCVQLKPDSGYTDDGQLRAWVAARFSAESYPAEFTLGDGQRQIIGSYFNRPLRFGRRHRVFIRALAPHNVTIIDYVRLIVFEEYDGLECGILKIFV